MHVLNRNCSLRGERADEPDRALVESVDLEAPQQNHADDPLGREHRDAQHRPLAAELARLVPLVGRIGQNVVDLHDAALEADPPDQRSRRRGDRCVGDERAVLRRPAEQKRQSIHVALELVDHAGVRATKPYGMPYDRLEHRLELEGRAADNLQDLACRSLLLHRLREFPR